jgi:hypothetical protein
MENKTTCLLQAGNGKKTEEVNHDYKSAIATIAT